MIRTVVLTTMLALLLSGCGIFRFGSAAPVPTLQSKSSVTPELIAQAKREHWLSKADEKAWLDK